MPRRGMTADHQPAETGPERAGNDRAHRAADGNGARDGPERRAGGYAVQLH